MVKGKVKQLLSHRTLRLACLTDAYAPLWTSVADDAIRDDIWTADQLCESTEFEKAWAELDPHCWDWLTPLHTDLFRRQALLEIDVLVALFLELRLDELLTIYRVQFPVMRQYEMVDEYDAQGGTFQTQSERIREQKRYGMRESNVMVKSILVTWEEDAGQKMITKTFYPPFKRVDREVDYERAYSIFEKMLKKVSNVEARSCGQ